jgi:hypothetical protein
MCAGVMLFLALRRLALRAYPSCQLGATRVYSRAFRKFRLRVQITMEINPILNSIKDLSERSLTIRGYL